MIPKINFDVAVIGSGPAGSIAAQKLSSSGLKVILFEKTNPPRYKTCGGGIVKRVLKFLPADIFSVFEREFNEIEIIDHQADFNYRLKRNSPIVYMTMRKNFDYKLLEYARSSGTKVLDNCEVFNLSVNNEFVNIRTTKGEFKSAFIIGADGANGISLKKTGLKIKKKNLPALEYEITPHDSDLERFSSARFDFGFVPGGYAWIFPKNNSLSVGLGIFALRERKVNLNSYLNEYLRQLNFKKIINIEKHGFYIPVGTRRNIITSERILLTGDAASLADSLTAEGITAAVLSGQIAAQAIIEGNLNAEEVTFLYDQNIKRNLYKDLRASLLLNKIFYNYDGLRVFLIRKYGVKLCEIIADVISGKRKYSQLFHDPFNYLKLVKYYFTPVGTANLKAKQAT